MKEISTVLISFIKPDVRKTLIMQHLAKFFKFVLALNGFKPGVPNPWPAGHLWPARHICVAREPLPKFKECYACLKCRANILTLITTIKELAFFIDLNKTMNHKNLFYSIVHACKYALFRKCVQKSATCIDSYWLINTGTCHLELFCQNDCVFP